MYKLVVTGSCFVGKSALTIQFIYNYFVSVHNPTYEDTNQRNMVVDKELCQVVIQDTTSTELFYPLRDEALRLGDGFLLVYAVNDFDSFNSVNIFLDLLRKIKKKRPCTHGVGQQRAGEPTLGKEVAKSFGVPFVETSAKTRQGVEQAFHELVREIHTMRDEEENKKKQGCGFKFCTIM